MSSPSPYYLRIKTKPHVPISYISSLLTSEKHINNNNNNNKSTDFVSKRIIHQRKMAKELEITELRLGLPGAEKSEKKRVFSEISSEEDDENGKAAMMINKEQKMNSKSQVVGWPPVCSYRKKNSFNDKDGSQASKMYVKVSMDGAPFLRKIDLGMHKGYSDLAAALEKLFGEALRDADSCEFVPIYEDKDGDWMLVGDVPWEMFIESCKRLRIMKRADAMGFGVLRSRETLNATLKE